MSIWARYKEEMFHVRSHLMETAPKEPGQFFPWESGLYKWEHTLTVLNLGLELAKEEKADIDVVALASIFHDVCYYTADYIDHGHEGAKHAIEYMKKKYPNELIANVSYAIDVHVGEMNPKTIEAKIIQDADTVDKVGATGVALILLNAGSNKLLFKDAIDKYKKEYLNKLDFMIKSMWTTKGKKIVTERANFLTEFFKKLEAELTI